MKRIIIFAALTLVSYAAFGQAVRVDIPLQTAGNTVPFVGGPLPQALWVANSTVVICSHVTPYTSQTYANCAANPKTTYIDSAESATCPTSTPLVQLPGNTCTASTGTTANLGFWYSGGYFDYYVVSAYGTYGPFTNAGSISSAGGYAALAGAAFTGPVSAPLVSTQTSPVYDVTNPTYGTPSGCANVADNTGVLNSTCAINAAIAAANSSLFGGDVFIPAGTYSIAGLNASHATAVFYHTVRIRGAGRWNTVLSINTAGAIGIDMIGTNDWVVQDLTITTGAVQAQAGILLARSTTSTNANGNKITDVIIQGNFSVCAAVSIAAEVTTWTRPYFSNNGSTNNYCAFATSGQNDFGVSSTYGTIYASTNTSNVMIDPEFYEPYTNAVPVIFSSTADYSIYGGIVLNTNATGGCLVDYLAQSNAFTGPVQWIGTHFEGQQTSVHCLVGSTGTNYFNYISQKGGDNVVAEGVGNYFNYIGGNDNNSTIHNYLMASDFSPENFLNTSGVAAVTVSGMQNTKIDLCRNGLVGLTDAFINVESFVQNVQLCALTYAVTNTATSNPNGGYAGWTGWGTTAPTGGVFPVGFTQYNSTPTLSSAVSWTATTAGYVVSGAWAATTPYTAGTYVTHASNVYKAVVGGTTASTGPSQSIGLYVDGTVTWMYVAPTSIGVAVFTPNPAGGSILTTAGGQTILAADTVSSADQSTSRWIIKNTGGNEFDLVAGFANVGQTGFDLYDKTNSKHSLTVNGTTDDIDVGGTADCGQQLCVSGGIGNANGTVIPSTVTGNTGSSSGKVSLVPGTEAFGYATLASGTVTVSNAAACTPSATCVYKLTNCGASGTTTYPGYLTIGTTTPGTSFVINSVTSAAGAVLTTDTSKVCWQIN